MFYRPISPGEVRSVVVTPSKRGSMRRILRSLSRLSQGGPRGREEQGPDEPRILAGGSGERAISVGDLRHAFRRGSGQERQAFPVSASLDLPELQRRAEAWIAGDPDETTRAELATILAQSDENGLAERFAMPLRFGTAGMRGLIGAGPGRMNRAVVIRTSY